MGPEYETIYAFGGLCMVSSIEEIIYLNDLCDRLGMDTITAGNLAAFAIEASKRKKIKENLQYGDVDGIAEILTEDCLPERDRPDFVGGGPPCRKSLGDGGGGNPCERPGACGL